MSSKARHEAAGRVRRIWCGFVFILRWRTGVV
jgi:hypothetical protein